MVAEQNIVPLDRLPGWAKQTARVLRAHVRTHNHHDFPAETNRTRARAHPAPPASDNGRVSVTISGSGEEVARLMLNLRESGSHWPEMPDSPSATAAPPAPPITSEQAVTMWLTSHERRGRDPKNEANYRRWVQAFIRDQKLEHPEAITAKAIARYLENLTTAGSSAANINNQRTAINQFCKWARRYEILRDNPCEAQTAGGSCIASAASHGCYDQNGVRCCKNYNRRP